MRRITLFFITAVTGCITSLPLAAATLITSDGHISGNSTWTSAGSPYRISGTLTVDPGVKLVIEPGVEVQLEERAGITIHGTLQARGSSSLLIHFLPADEETHWGHILFSDTTATPSYDDQLVFRQGSILEYCVFEGGGNVPAEDYNGGTVACIQASPVIQDCRFMGNRAPRGGAILCHRFSAPLIRRNTFSDNAATVDDGGGICIFLYSNPIIQDNLFLRNRAARSGGAIYLSVANATIKHNTLINNNADEYGGGIYMSSTQAIIEENAFLNNHGWDGSGTLYLVADSCPQIRRNSLAGSGYLVYLDNVTCPVELRENWWQTVNEVEVELKIRKSFTRKPTIPIIYQPILLSPPESLPTQPVELKQLRIMTDRTWSEELRNDLAPDARIQVEIQAEDRNPWSRDQTATRLYILDKPLQSFELILQETELASGIFRGEAWVRNETNPLEREIGAVVGDTIVVESTIDPAFHQQYHVGEGVPYVSNFSFTSEIDISHVIDPAIELSWNYFDLRRHPQQQIQIQIATNADFAPPDLLDTGFFAYTETSWKYDGARLVDGQKYHLRIRVSDGERYSPWNSITIRNDNAVYSFRMNSLPALPGVVAPVAGTVVNQSQPLLQCEEMADAEGDQLNYEFELFETEFRRQLVTSGNGDRPQFKPSVSLPDNATRWWRVRIYDGFEYTHWSELYSFQVNSVEEPPTGPGLLEPFGSTYSLSPLFRWLPAEDPDPQAELHYYLQLSTTGSFATAEKLPAGDGTSMQLQESISNGVEYFWSVTAVDQTGRETASRIGKFQADTQPSLPLLSYPLNRQELGSGLTFQVVAAVDPDPGDQLIYDLQVAVDEACRQIVSQETDLILEELNRLTAPDLIATMELQDNTPYYWRVQARDQHDISSGWSAAQEFILNLRNDPPTAPQLAAPQHGAVVRTTQPRLSWAPLLDPDPGDSADRLQLLVEFNRDSEFQAGLTRSYLTDPGASSFTPPEPLTDNCRWYLRLRSRDTSGAESDPAGPFTFVVNTVEEPPGEFLLLTPAPGGNLSRLENITLSWQPAPDNDLDATVVYHIEVATDDQFLEPIFTREDYPETTILLPGPLPNAATCYWGVTAQDNSGLQTRAVTDGTFRLDTTPSPPQLLHRDELLGDAILSWGAALDPNPEDRISYRLQLWERDGAQLQATLDDIEQPGLAATELAARAGLSDNSSWEYSLTAIDNHGVESETTTRDWFRLNLVNDPPAIPDCGSAVGDPQLLSEERLLVEWSGAVDPDFNDAAETLAAELQLDPTPYFSSPQLDVHPVPPGTTTLELRSLQDNTRWFYRVRTVDDEGAASGWSVTRSFVVNLAEEPPARVTVIRPEPGSQQVDLTTLDLVFTEPSDPDYGDVVTSVVEISEDHSFNDLLLQVVCEGTHYKLNTELNSGATYYLRVICSDRTGLTAVSDVTTFFVDSHPTVPRPLNPEPTAPLAVTERLEWQGSSDPDSRDTIRYRVEIARNVLFTTPVVVQDDLRVTELALSALPLDRGVQYYWRVRAIDNHNLQSAYCQPGRFQLQVDSQGAGFLPGTP